jgi:phenylalanine-4-hydroxylase
MFARPEVKKIPLTVDCIETSYDITEKQPQLFVTPNFEHLHLVLEDLAKKLALRIGGAESS